MKIQFKTPITDGDITRSGVTVDHVILHLPQQQIVFNNVSAAPITLSIEGLSESGAKAYWDFLAAMAEEFLGEYEEGTVTARIAEKREAAESARVEAERASLAELKPSQEADQGESLTP